MEAAFARLPTSPALVVATSQKKDLAKIDEFDFLAFLESMASCGKCRNCGKTVYQLEAVTAIDKVGGGFYFLLR